MRKILPLLMLMFAAFTATAQSVSYNGVRQDVILDVRTPAEFALGHIQGAVNIPLDRLTSEQALNGIDKNAQILVYCRSGRRSAEARQRLKQQGFQHVHDGGGMTALESKLKACDARLC